jgi:hypothetical protein
MSANICALIFFLVRTINHEKNVKKNCGGDIIPAAVGGKDR